MKKSNILLAEILKRSLLAQVEVFDFGEPRSEEWGGSDTDDEICENDSDCPNCKVCNDSNFCVLSGECSNSADCPTGQICEDCACVTEDDETGACCADIGNCSVKTQEACARLGGSYMGNGVSCGAAGVCPVGACCEYVSGEGCEMRGNAAACAAHGGEYKGDGTHCQHVPSPCHSACCRSDNTCEMTYEQDCMDMGEYWHGTKSCDDWPAPCECDKPTDEATGGNDYEQWLNEQMGCCECLVDAETHPLEPNTCMLPVAWVMYNRRRQGGYAQGCSGDERTPCIQATNNGAFQGGWDGPSVEGAKMGLFKRCFCPEHRVDSRHVAARSACHQIGLNNYRKLPDPSIPASDANDEVWSKIGANFYYAPGFVPNYMDAAVQRGLCRAVTHGIYPSCMNKFFRCKQCPPKIIRPNE